jgi:hypothetical protein
MSSYQEIDPSEYGFSVLPCPFCGNTPTISFSSTEFHTMWAHIACRKCRVTVHVGEFSTIAYWENGKGYVTCRTPDEAKKQSLEWAVNTWNTRK